MVAFPGIKGGKIVSFHGQRYLTRRDSYPSGVRVDKRRFRKPVFIRLRDERRDSEDSREHCV
jgi:hypothetical protein